MSSSLPAITHQKLEQTLAQWRQWSCAPRLTAAPLVVATLGAGKSNFSVLVRAAQRQFVVRIDGINPARHGLNRQLEWRALTTASAAGIAPCPRYFNPDLGSLVCDFLTPDTHQTSDIAEVAGLLKEIHRLPPRRHRLDLGDRARRYEHQLESRSDELTTQILQHRAAITHCIGSTASADQDSVLCHNDLLHANRLRCANQLYALDWEYCAMASRWYDLAVVCVGDELTGAQRDQLVRAYCGRTITRAEANTLHSYECIYGYLELLWYQVQNSAATVPADQTRRLAALQRRLSAMSSL